MKRNDLRVILKGLDLFFMFEKTLESIFQLDDFIEYCHRIPPKRSTKLPCELIFGQVSKCLNKKALSYELRAEKLQLSPPSVHCGPVDLRQNCR